MRKNRLPEKFGIQAVPHKKFDNLYACRIFVPFEGVFWVVDAARNIECFGSYDAAMGAGAKLLVPILNRKIFVPPAALVPPHRAVPGICRNDDPEVEFGFFGYMR